MLYRKNKKTDDMKERCSFLILNGPNLTSASKTELRAFSSNWLDEVEEMCREQAVELDISVDFFQSNIEGELVGRIQDASRNYDGIIINPSGYGFSSWVMHDALKLSPLPVVEINLVNGLKDEIRDKTPVTARAADIVIAGAGDYGYLLAMDAMVQLLDKNKNIQLSDNNNRNYL